MDERKGWLKEVFEDVNRDVQTWPNWLKDDNRDIRKCSAECDELESKPKAKSANVG